METLVTISCTPQAAVMRVLPFQDDHPVAAAIDHLTAHGYQVATTWTHDSQLCTRWHVVAFVRPGGGPDLPPLPHDKQGPLVRGVSLIHVPAERDAVQARLNLKPPERDEPTGNAP